MVTETLHWLQTVEENSAGEKDFKGAAETFEEDRYVHYLGCSDGFMVRKHVRIYQILYTLNICNYYVNLASIKLTK